MQGFLSTWHARKYA
uniref:Uncharacterized protein n=1 Tax=Rhizophora mucronata TaxID=61149 RepID=A0A2P2PQK6_RHIMU